MSIVGLLMLEMKWLNIIVKNNYGFDWFIEVRNVDIFENF